ncbi:DUF11 domain-containing protein [Candidatus Pacebacteria bacterium]|nr:DUF11 domain-containing protein [Candidatus Paceibacterota bacterium]
MSNFKDEERIKELRQRLYARGSAEKKSSAYQLTDEPTDVAESWQNPPNTPKTKRQTDAKESESPLAAGASTVVDKLKRYVPARTPAQASAPVSAAKPAAGANATPPIDPMARPSKRKRYRKVMLLAGLAFFVLAVTLSSMFFFFGNNSISGENINVTLSGPFTIGGGEAIPLQIGITNQNAVPIESATLIVTYPPGTKSAEEEGKELFVERLPLDTVGPGETLNIPLRAIVFGEENQEREIRALVEYRVDGSNSIFEKAAEPLRFKISSSPVVMSVQSVHKVSSGQETDIVLEVRSNSPNTLTDIVVRADYPSGFDFYSSEPSPVAGQNVWLIEELAPEQTTTITVSGVVVGQETDEYTMHFSIGVGAEGNRLDLSSILSTISTDFALETPFIDVQMALNGNGADTVPVTADSPIRVEVIINNTLEDSIFDGRAELELSGNALSDYEVRTNGGFYDSANNRVVWDHSELDNLREILPGETTRLTLTLNPDPDIKVTPELGFTVDVRARRVSEGRATEELIGTAQAAAKVNSVASLITEVARGTSVFTEYGPLPPIAEEETSYTITMFVENGTNDVGDVEVAASLPLYVTWLGETSGAGSFSYNEVARTITWDAGDIDANQSKIGAFQVELLPSISQIGTTPTLVGEQRLRATDRFTGSVIRSSKSARTTQLSSEAGYPGNIGVVVDVNAEAAEEDE